MGNNLTTSEIGRFGEDAAAEYLIDKGYSILERNYHYSHREIDIIAENDTHLLFVEVKARTERNNNISRYGRPATAVNTQKQKLLVSAAMYYLKENKQIHKKPRLDVIEVYFSPISKFGKPVVNRIHHIENAFYSS